MIRVRRPQGFLTLYSRSFTKPQIPYKTVETEHGSKRPNFSVDTKIFGRGAKGDISIFARHKVRLTTLGVKCHL